MLTPPRLTQLSETSALRAIATSRLRRIRGTKVTYLRGTPEDSNAVGATPEQAARELFEDPHAQVAFEAGDEAEARRAVAEFGRLFEAAPGVFKVALQGARAGAETLSGDRLQGIAEIIQNADDAGATFVEFWLIDGFLVAVHDGRPVTLADVLALAMPWLSNKTDDARSTGRFGIGLTTLQALSKVLDVHSGFYHVRLGTPTVSAIDNGELPLRLGGPLDTALCVPLPEASLSIKELDDWLGQWDDSALLFLRHVREIRLVGPDGDVARELCLRWDESIEVSCPVGDQDVVVLRSRVEAQDGRAWHVHTTEVIAPEGVARASKATGDTVPLGIALPVRAASHGVIYAGMPVAAFRVPVRVHAPFDPVTSRTGLASTSWNRALLPLLGDLWTEAVLDLLAGETAEAWKVIPLPADGVGSDDPRSIPERLELLLLSRARASVAAGAEIPVDGALRPLTGLAVEDIGLEGVLEPAEVADLAGLEAALPAIARDGESRWRRVLDDWRQADAPLPPVVTVARALSLLSQSDRSTAATISLTAAALVENLTRPLMSLPCVVTSDGTHVRPPLENAVQALLATESPLAEQLAIGTRLASEYLSPCDDAEQVLSWLKSIGAVIDSPGNEEVLRRLAEAGNAGHQVLNPLTDDQLRSLRDAFEQLGPSRRAQLGRGVGRAITIDAFKHNSRGQQVSASASPADLYLPAAIDRDPDSFAIAAGKTPGLLWAHRRYAEVLRSTAGRTVGLGPQKFLGLLGAERMPRLIPHSGLIRRFSNDRRPGLLRYAGPRQRRDAMNDISATYTLDDTDSPDLRAVGQAVSRERKATPRRQRAAALLATVSRMLNSFEDQTSVDAASDYYSWYVRGSIRAFWLWDAGTIAWLDDTHGRPQTPVGLRLRTPGTIAVHGQGADGYLHPQLDIRSRRETLAVLGVSGEPSTRDLVERLRSLRDNGDALTPMTTDAAIIYRAIADRLETNTRSPDDLTHKVLHAVFHEGDGLLLTSLGWRTPPEVLLGPAVFRDHRPFVPQISGTAPLWSFLGIRGPDIDDCYQVISEVSRTGHQPEGDDIPVLLESLRLLATLLNQSSSLPTAARRRLAVLPLWTTCGWAKRPVYATSDPSLSDGLRDDFPIWDPGGDLAQFGNLIQPLRITPIDTSSATVVHTDTAIRDDDATSLFGAAVALLQEDLVRNDPASIEALAIRWDLLRQFEVRIDPGLRVHVDSLPGQPDIEVPVKADPARRVIFVRDADYLRQVNRGGRAVAGLFKSHERHRLAQAWLAAWVAAEDGRTAQLLQLAAQQAAEEEATAEQAIAERQEALKTIADRGGSHRPTAAGSPASRKVAGPSPQGIQPSNPESRVLVDPEALAVSNPDAPREEPASTGGRTGRVATPHGVSPLPQPSLNGATPRGQSMPRSFTDLDKESVGLALLRKIIEDGTVTIADHRGQHGFGADAQDSRGWFYELKVYLGDEPDAVRMEDSEILRALSVPGKYFLVVISNIEGADAQPKVRVIADPVHQLTVSNASAMTLSGIRAAKDSLVYNLKATGQR